MPVFVKRFLQAAVLTPTLVFALGLVLAVAGAWWQQQEIASGAANEFQRRLERVSAEITRRFGQPVYGLNGLRGAYAATGGMNRAQFRSYVESRDLSVEFAGVRGFGFIQRVARKELDTFIAAERGDGAPQFSLKLPSTEMTDDHYVIRFIEPAADNIGAEGLDVVDCNV